MNPEKLPLTGIRLLRWRLAVKVYALGCWISGRHEHLAVFDEQWKDRHCPHCGKVFDE